MSKNKKSLKQKIAKLQSPKKYMTKKRKHKIFMRNSILLITATCIGVAFIGYTSAKEVNYQTVDIKVKRVTKEIKKEVIEVAELDLEETYYRLLKTTDFINYVDSLSKCANNNPGNLVYARQPNATKNGRWASYSTPILGFRALLKQLELDQSRGFTVEEFVNKYAPNFENDTNFYIYQLCEWLEVGKNTKIKDINIFLLAQAIVKKECGVSGPLDN